MTGVEGEHVPYLLIDYTWCPVLDDDLRVSLREFTVAAYQADREAGFTSIAMAGAGEDDRSAGHLVVYTMDSDGEFTGVRRLAGYLALDAPGDGGVIEGRFVVAPEHRSRGVATLLVEKLWADRAAHRWFGLDASRVRVIATGSHPAALRLADRFGFPVSGERWSLLANIPRTQTPEPIGRSIFDTIDSVAPASVVNGVVRPAPEGADTDGRLLTERRYLRSGAAAEDAVVVRHSVDGQDRPDATAQLECRPGLEMLSEPDVDALFDLVLSDLAGRGARSVVADVDPSDMTIVRASRRKDFHHDQSNVVVEVRLAS
ncbi:hypothetical protein GCM10023094_11540 [Rhodococcus olei]|uniref:N-acetyltransferase domain-containing protein n=1 Tax=Rhodococcus olei TaxID=2161675 RepID=A0ABP8NVE8_9NOCA